MDLYKPRAYTIFVGSVPLVITPTFTFFFGVSGEVDGGFSVGVSQTALVTGGLSYSNGKASPVFEQTMNITPDPIALDASLSAKAYGGVAVSLNVDEVLSPEFSPDVFLQLDVNPLGNPWWTLSAGLEGSGNIDVSLFGIATLASWVCDINVGGFREGWIVPPYLEVYNTSRKETHASISSQLGNAP
ncbi:MAG: hypothetical protein ACLQKA_11025, partial [Bryobacteraceae bacterium]